MIFVESEVDKRSRMFKKVKEIGYAAEMARQDFAAFQMGRRDSGQRGKKITGRTMELS